MRVISIISLLFCQLISAAQQISDNNDNLISGDDFSGVTGFWEQRSNAGETFLVDKGGYILKNRNKNRFVTSMLVTAIDLSSYKVEVSLKVTGKKEQSAGLVLNANKAGSSAIICEISSSGRYRVRKLQNGEWITLSVTDHQGWVKDRNLRRKRTNQIRIVQKQGQFDLYLNSVFVFAFADKDLRSGNLGYYLSPSAGAVSDYIRIYSDSSSVKPAPETREENADVVKLMKDKIDQLQAQVNSLKKDLDRCQGDLATAGKSTGKQEDLNQKYQAVLKEKSKLEAEVASLKGQLAKLQSVKETLDKNPNQDLILSLNELYLQEKKKYQELNEKYLQQLEEVKKLNALINETNPNRK